MKANVLIAMALASALCFPAFGQQTPREPLTKDFDTLDKNGDGSIHRLEAENENVNYHFDAIDKDKNETLSREEFTRYIAEEEPLLGKPKKKEELPQAYLRERSGSQSQVVTNPSLLPKIEAEFAELDNDDDSFISRNEAEDDEIYRHFMHIDRNDDSRISSQEYNTYLREHGTQVATKELMEKVRL